MEELRDLEDVTVDASLPVEERVRSFAEQIGDPYHFTTHGVEVRLSFAGQIPIEGSSPGSSGSTTRPFRCRSRMEGRPALPRGALRESRNRDRITTL